ncbi:MAG: aldose 1-epimerase family protein [bacterium]|nr:aldose 1-epimerase family protein [bacterium]
MPGHIAPSGQQLEIACNDQHAIIVEVGGGVRSYGVGEHPIIDGYDVDQMCKGGRGQLLIPWPNRIEDGRYRVGDEDLQLDLSEPALHNAIHGLVRFSNWVVAEREPARVVMEHVLHAKPGYPFVLALRVEYTLSPRGLHVRSSARNLSARPAPFGMGAHPYLTVGTPTIDSAWLQVAGEHYLPVDERGRPTGRRRVDGTPNDFRRARPIGDLHIDVAFTDLLRDGDGRARVELRAPDGTRALALWADDQFPYVEIYSGDTLTERRRHGLAVEPMTCPSNAFRSGDSVKWLAPEEQWTGAWGIEPVTAPR